MIAALAEIGANPDARTDGMGWTALHFAAGFTKDADVITALAQIGVDPNSKDEAAMTPLHIAAQYSRNPRSITVLAELGADPDARAIGGISPLHIAALFAEDFRVFAALAEVGADPNARDDDGETPLHLAVGARDVADHRIIHSLVEIGASPDLRDENGFTPLLVAAQHARDSRVVDALIEGGADPHARNGGLSPLATATTFNPTSDVAATLLKAHVVDQEPMAEPTAFPFRRAGLRRVRCWFDASAKWPNKECFFMVVNEDPHDALTALVAFPVVRFFTGLAKSEKNPILHLGGGGPGNSLGLEIEPAYLWQAYRGLVASTGRDLYAMDPRGVGMAYPKLHCSEILEFFRNSLAHPMTAREEIDRMHDSYRECKERLDKDHRNLSFYNSRTVAQDVEQLRRSLKVDKWILLGVSYGTRYALTIARDFPEIVEAMLFFSATFPNVRYTDRAADRVRKAFERAFTWCVDLRTCDVQSMRGRLQAMVSSLNRSPLVIDKFSRRLRESHDIESIVLTGSRLMRALHFAFYDAEFFPQLPELVDELERGRTRILEDVLSNWFDILLDETHSDPISYSHYCAEEHPFANYDSAFESARSLHAYIRIPVINYWLYDSKLGCRLWNVPAAGQIEGEPVRTSIPTLFLQGALDPVTPVDYLNEQLRYFKRSAVLIFEDSSHWGEAMEGSCAMEAAEYFIEYKRLSDEHTQCARN